MSASTTPEAGAPATPELDRLSREELKAWGGFLRTHARIVRRFDAEMRAAHGISLSAYEVLLFLAFAPQRRKRMSELAQTVLLTPSGVTRVVDRLVREGLVERCGDATDLRATHALLTDLGYERLREAQATHLAGVREAFLSRCTQEDLDALARIWEKLAAD